LIRVSPVQYSPRRQSRNSAYIMLRVGHSRYKLC